MSIGPIYIIDDDDDVRSIVNYALEFEGYRVIAFQNPLDAIEHLKIISPADYPSLIIVDYMMPVMDGAEFIKVVKSKLGARCENIPIILSSGRLDFDSSIPNDIEILLKPVDLNDLLILVNKYSSHERHLPLA